MPILDHRSLEFFSHSPEQTKRLGMRLGSLLIPGSVVCLEGNLGAGKTTFVQGISQGWGSLDQVTSPTYVIVNEYGHPDGQTLFHLDAYRLNGPEDAEILDLDRMLLNGVLIIEWPERIKEVIPKSHLWVQMQWIAVEQRHFYMMPHGRLYEKMLQKYRKQLFGAD